MRRVLCFTTIFLSILLASTASANEFFSVVNYYPSTGINTCSTSLYQNNACWLNYTTNSNMYSISGTTLGSDSFYSFNLNTTNTVSLQAYNDSVYYVDIDGANYGLYNYDISNQSSVSLGLCSSEKIEFCVSGNHAVWSGNTGGGRALYCQDLTTGISTKISNLSSISKPSISGCNIIWSNEVDGKQQIFKYDMSNCQTTQLTSSATDKSKATIEGNKIVWLESDGTSQSLVTYDLDTQTTQTVFLVSDQMMIPAPQVSGNILTWHDQIENYQWAVMMYDFTTDETTILTNPHYKNAFYSSVYEDTIIWATSSSFYGSGVDGVCVPEAGTCLFFLGGLPFIYAVFRKK